MESLVEKIESCANLSRIAVEAHGEGRKKMARVLRQTVQIELKEHGFVDEMGVQIDRVGGKRK